MHHELFFALLGHPGDVVEARDDGFFVRADVSFLTPPQRVMINRLLQLGHAFSVLDRFVATARQLPSLFVRALAQGIESILIEYSDAVVQLEAKVLTTRVVFPIPQMVYELEEFGELLPELRKLVLMIHSGSSSDLSTPRPVVRGASLLRVLHGLTDSGFPRLRKRMSDLQRCCHTILFKQIVSWMAYGDIVDPFDEFFVRKLEEDESNSSEIHGDAIEAIESRIWQVQYGIKSENAPPYIPSQVIESIFFIGRSVQILSRSKGFSSEEAFWLTQKFAKVQSSEFSRVTLERVVEDIRTDIASRLYEQIVVKADFVEHLKLLKNMFLLARGELFQSLLDQTSSSLMAVKPSLKSDEELHHGVWSHILREYQVDENPLIHRFRLELPLQTFRFPPFPDASGLCLKNMVLRDRALHIDESSQSCGVAWWPHRQVEHLPFTSTIMVDLSSSQVERLTEWAGGKVALLLTKDASFPLPCAKDQTARAPLYGIEADIVSIELEVRLLENDSTHVAAVASVAMHSSDKDGEMKKSSPTLVPLEKHTVTFYVQYARTEVCEANGKLSSARTLTIIVNGNDILEFECDLTSILGSGALTIDHYVGLYATSGICTREWRVDKYGPRTYTLPGRLLSESHQSLSARELWIYLTMRCDLKWPMHLLVSEGLLRSYGHLFQFSFRIKRVAHALERTWKLGVFRQRSRVDQGDAASDVSVLRAAAALRSRMSFVVRNLEQFFQVFVVESSFAKCLADIDGAEDFDKVKRVHEQFVAQLVRRFYLHTQTMQSAIDQVLRCCWDFAEYASYQEGARGTLLAERVADLETQFDDRFALLLRTLRHPNMRDLLLLLDFNGFFSREP